MATVSVIIPTHNRPQLLPRAIESAFASGTNVEVVVVDDASIDKTAEVCRSIPGITYIRLNQNEGVAGARNAGINASSSEFIALLDDDDIRLSGTIDLQVAALKKADAAMIYGQALFAGATDRLNQERYPDPCPTGDVFWQLLTQNFIPSGSVVIRRTCLPGNNPFVPTIAGIDDWDLWLRIAANHSIVAVEEPVVIWRRPSPGSDQGSARAVEIVKSSTRQFQNSWLKMPKIEAAEPDRKRRAIRQFSENMASHLVNEAIRSVSCGELINANRCLLTAVRFHSRGLLSRVAREFSSKE